MLVGGVLFDEPELDWRAFVAVGLSQTGFEVAAVTPVDEAGVAAEDLEGWDWVIRFLDHVI